MSLPKTFEKFVKLTKLNPDTFEVELEVYDLKTGKYITNLVRYCSKKEAVRYYRGRKGFIYV